MELNPRCPIFLIFTHAKVVNPSPSRAPSQSEISESSAVVPLGTRRLPQSQIVEVTALHADLLSCNEKADLSIPLTCISASSTTKQVKPTGSLQSKLLDLFCTSIFFSSTSSGRPICYWALWLAGYQCHTNVPHVHWDDIQLCSSQ